MTDLRLMDETIPLLVERYLGQRVIAVAPLGGGFYGRVFAARLAQEPWQVAVKFALFPGLHLREREQLAILGKHARLPMPEVLALHDADAEIPFDALLMTFLEGINCGKTNGIPTAQRAHIADQIIDTLVGFHETVNPSGFGELGGPYASDWRSVYRSKAEASFGKAVGLYERGQINRHVLATVERAWAHFDAIFARPVEAARLIHGDYNTWNVLINAEATEAVAVIDPFGCMWADAEMELYQLNNANGRDFALLERYAERMPLHEDFALRSGFYELFSEVMHYFDAGVDASRSALPSQAQALATLMNDYGYAGSASSG